MPLNRREFLKLAGMVSAGAVMTACTPNLLEKEVVFKPEIAKHFWALSRLTYGPRSEELALAAEIGLGAWIEEQLAPQNISDPVAEFHTRRLSSLGLSADALEGWEREDVIKELKYGALLREVFSRKQLYEIMVGFWTDHFNIHIGKEYLWALKPVDDREVIRKNALGNFGDLLWGSAHSPAMLIYLDNQTNHKDLPNENYAREVLELHTLGVDSGYTQKDVMELARCLTGWTVKEHFWRGEFTFNEDMHDQGTKTVLGNKIEANGQAETEQVLKLLATHSSTAEFIATKLVRRFICDQPEIDAPDLINQAAKTFLSTKGDIKSVLRVILLDGMVSSPELVKPKIKRPIQFITSTLRGLNAKYSAKPYLFRLLSSMGQSPYEWPTPDGPPDYANAWNKNLMPRWKFAMDIASQNIPGVEVDFEGLVRLEDSGSIEDILNALSLRLLGAPYPEPHRSNIIKTLRGEVNESNLIQVFIAGLLASPAYQFR